ncbi:aminotransferase class I/II-fold pyridoxal phosphate-dependent enzyme, partial [Aduncisulcus paluster]
MTSQIQYDFKYGMLNPDKLPIRQWQRLMNKSIRSEEEKMSFYGPMFGEPDLREEIRKYLKYYRGVECTTDQLFIGAGVHYCLGMLCQLLKDETAAIAMEDPGYHVTRSTIKNHGFAVESI